MENKTYKFISVGYELHSILDGVEEFVEKTEDARPLTFYTGCEMTIPAFEEKVINATAGEKLEFNLTKEQAYGLFIPENVLDLDKALFSPEGTFDAENVFIGATIPLQNEEGNRFMGKVLEISDDKVKVDLNHPLAGKELKFKVEILESREATEEEVRTFFEQMNAHHCSGGCSCGNGDGETCGCGSEGHKHGECGCHKD